MSDAALEQIKEIAQQARTTWFTLLGFLTFAGITLLGFEHADFWAYGRRTDLPLVGVSIPTTSFFAATPALITALNVYFHLQLMQLWQAIDDAPSVVGSKRLDCLAHPGLITNYALCLKGDRAAGLHTLTGVACWVVFLLVWVFAPLVLASFWWTSMAARCEVLTLFIAFVLVFATWVGLRSRRRVRELRFSPIREPSSRRVAARRTLLIAAAFAVTVVSWTRAEGGFRYYAGILSDKWHVTVAGAPTQHPKTSILWSNIDQTRSPRGILYFFQLAPVELVGVELVARPDTWRDYDIARRSFVEG